MFVKTSISNSLESLGYIKCYSSSSSRPVKSPRNSIRSVRRSAVDQEDLKPYWKSEKRPHFSRACKKKHTSLLFITLIVWGIAMKKMKDKKHSIE